MTDNGILTCLERRPGEVKYEGGRVPEPAKLHGLAGGVRRELAPDEQGR